LIAGSLTLMYSTNGDLTLRILPLLILTGVVISIFVWRLGPLFMQVQKKLDTLNSILQENIAGVRVVKAFVRSEHEEARFEIANQNFTETHIRVMRYFATFSPTLTMLVNIGIVLVVWLGGIQSIQGKQSVGEIVAFADYLLTTMSPLLVMAMLANVLASAMVSAERVEEIFKTTPEIQDRPANNRMSTSFTGRVVFHNVCFSYHGACDEKVLDGISFVAEPGETVAILGATGSGKTTLINLIPRFYDVDEGSITIDGIDVRDIKQTTLLEHIGITPQDTILFSGSIHENICFGKPDASEQEVVQAARAAQIHEFIKELPKDYDTQVAQRGVNLSGGQKQRIAIARAILHRPRILILDDSTSAVDVETEANIQLALNEIMRDSTCFIVTQRISTVLNADKIIILDMGQIAAQGSHSQLMKASPIYREIYDSQLGNGNHLKSIMSNKIIYGRNAFA